MADGDRPAGGTGEISRASTVRRSRRHRTTATTSSGRVRPREAPVRAVSAAAGLLDSRNAGYARDAPPGDGSKVDESRARAGRAGSCLRPNLVTCRASCFRPATTRAPERGLPTEKRSASPRALPNALRSFRTPPLRGGPEMRKAFRREPASAAARAGREGRDQLRGAVAVRTTDGSTMTRVYTPPSCPRRCVQYAAASTRYLDAGPQYPKRNASCSTIFDVTGPTPIHRPDFRTTNATSGCSDN